MIVNKSPAVESRQLFGVGRHVIFVSANHSEGLAVFIKQHRVLFIADGPCLLLEGLFTRQVSRLPVVTNETPWRRFRRALAAWMRFRIPLGITLRPLYIARCIRGQKKCAPISRRFVPVC